MQSQQTRRQHQRLILQVLGIASLSGLFLMWLSHDAAHRHQLNMDLVMAIIQNDAGKARALLNQGADPNARLPEDTSLAQALRDFRHRLTRTPSPPDTSVYRPSIAALALRRIDPAGNMTIPPENPGLIQAMLDKGADVNARDSTGDTLLMLALRAGYIDTVRILLNRGADVNTRNLYGTTPLMCLPYDTLDSRLPLLLDHGADLNAEDSFRHSVLMYACTPPHPDRAAVKLLLDRGAAIDARNTDGSTPLMIAARGGDPATVKLLLERGADANARDAAGESALIYAVNSRQEPALRVLLQQGAEVNVRARNGHTVLYCAEQNHLTRSVRLLKQHGARE